MKIKFDSLVRTNLGFPSEWKGKDEKDEDIVLYFRHGVLKYIKKALVLHSCSRDGLDVSGYLSDEDLKLLLQRENLI